MNPFVSKYFHKLTFKSELFLYTAPVPFVIYYFIIAGGYTENSLIPILLSSATAGIVTLSIGYLVRHILFIPLLNRLISNNETNLENLKIAILSYPKKEITTAVVRWILAGFVFSFAFSFFQKLSLKQTIVLILDIGSIIPISSLCYYYIAENIVSELILETELKNIPINPERIQFSNFVNRFLSVMLFSALPIISLFYLTQYFTQVDGYKIPHFHLQFFILFLIYLFVLYKTGKEGAKNFDLGIKKFSSLMIDYSKGNLKESLPITTRDEIGKISIYLNNFTASFKETLESIIQLTKEVLNFSNILAEHSQTLAENNSEQFTFLQDFSASLEEMSAVTDTIANNARLSSDQAKKAGEKLQNLENQISEISKIGVTASNNASVTTNYAEEGQKVLNDAINKIEELNISTNKITQAVNLISEVADQVNLLSLNASIESARAGEFGKGFAVVAGEISKLAEKTLGNSKEIIKSSKEVLKKSEEGRTYIQNTGSNFSEILDRVKETTNIVKNISSMSLKQIDLSKDVNTTFQSSLRMSEEISNATEEQQITNRGLIDNINKMNQLMENINSASEVLHQISNGLENKIKDLETRISYFQV
ncbi:MAG: methyl-accepting chemotaxis protein [Leptospiraceae bacterium]|nr:methyl-accepting chemotaxis protein [Leptospiraceae bacterium]